MCSAPWLVLGWCKYIVCKCIVCVAPLILCNWICAPLVGLRSVQMCMIHKYNVCHATGALTQFYNEAPPQNQCTYSKPVHIFKTSAHICHWCWWHWVHCIYATPPPVSPQSHFCFGATACMYACLKTTSALSEVFIHQHSISEIVLFVQLMLCN